MSGRVQVGLGIFWVSDSLVSDRFHAVCSNVKYNSARLQKCSSFERGLFQIVIGYVSNMFRVSVR